MSQCFRAAMTLIALLALVPGLGNARRPGALEPRSNTPGYRILPQPAAQTPVPASVATLDTFVLGEWDFEDGSGGPDPQGWTQIDRTAQLGTFFHVDDFAGLGGGLVPLFGSRSLWCGTRTGFPFNVYATAPGYGNYWRQTFQSVPFTVSGPVTVSFLARFDSEPDYDFTYVDYQSKTGAWQTIFECSGQADSMVTVAVPPDSIAGSVQLRLRFVSDGVYSDEDGLQYTDGAVIIDLLTVSDGGGVVDFQDFESETAGALATADGHWTAFAEPGFGDFSALQDGSTVLQEDPLVTNTTNLWTFFNGSPDTYACGGHPEQLAVPFSHDGLPLNNWIVSPPIDITHDINGVLLLDLFPVLVEFDVYRDLPLDNLVFYGWAVRSFVGGNAGTWRGGSAVNFGHDYVDWFRFHEDMTPYIEQGTTEIQIALFAVDMYPFWYGVYGSGACHTQAPLIDNVRVSRADEGSSFSVTNTLDSGPGSLREAILSANSNPDLSTIRFTIPGTGPHTIQPLTLLPAITSPTIINGYTQSGSKANTRPPWEAGDAVLMIELDGSQLGAGAIYHGLRIMADDCLVKGLAINRFGGAGIQISNGGNGNAVAGNYIGTDVTGTLPLGNAQAGIEFTSAPHTVVGGIHAADRNVIVNNQGYGISSIASPTSRIEGNFIGMDASGAIPLGNNGGVRIQGSRETIVGGTAPGARNVIAANTGGAVGFSGFPHEPGLTSVDCVVQGNFIGTDLTGTVAHGNMGGVSVLNASGVTIGGPAPGARNIIAASSGFDGVSLTGPDTHAIVQNNFIGTDVTGTQAFGNATGVMINGSFSNTIGGPGPDEGNIIANSQFYGVWVYGGVCCNQIRGNSIFANAALGIELGSDGVSPNDEGDADTGDNDLQNFPVIDSAVTGPGGTTVSGTISSIPAPGTYYLDFYSNDACDASGNGEGQVYLGESAVWTLTGAAVISVTLDAVAPAGSFLTATATDVYGNTSEFSVCVEVINTPVGSGIATFPVDATTGTSPVTVTFDDVTTAGITTLVTGPSGPPLPGGFVTGDSIYYDLSTTATFTGNIEVCLSYDESRLAVPEGALQLLHYDAGIPDWVDVTSSLDADANIVCGTVTSLSPFALVASSSTGIGPAPGVPEQLALQQNIPNPFNPGTLIRYDVPAGGADVTIAIYDVAGRLVQTLVDTHRPAGRYQASWDGRNTNGQQVATGVYFYRMHAGSFVQTRKMVLLK